MATNLTDWVDEQLQTAGIDDDVALLVLAALDGDDRLDDYLADGSAPTRSAGTAETVSEVEPNGVVLTSIAVEGFRGIGPKAELKIAPKPGLTIVAGRNGSGKSSFSEALELVLTGDTYRWKQKGAEWRDQWRNIHQPQSAQVTIGLIEEGVGPITVKASWKPSEASVAARTVTTQVAGKPQVTGTDHLGWNHAVEQFRPILSYDELGGMLDGKQSELYDALANILGVEQLTDAAKRLKARADARKGPGTALATRRRGLQTTASASSDERASTASTLLRKTSPDTKTLRSLATGGLEVDRGPINALRTLAALRGPDPEAATQAIELLRRAKNKLADAGSEVSARNRGRLRLLEDALRFHEQHGDQSCPVCRTGSLDEDWAEISRALAERERQQFQEVDAATQSFDLAFDGAQRLLQSRPPALDGAPVPDLTEPIQRAKSAWTDFYSASFARSADGADALCAHIEAHLPDLTDAVRCVSEAAATAVAALDDEWQPLASAIATWCDEWDDWMVTEPVVARLQAAEKWLKDNDLRLKNERLAPIEAGAKNAWQRLRQESNVELGSLQLIGLANRRKVKVTGAIDGEPVETFAVFSQGELHALTLSLFLPRATLAQSPFRFVVLDDPVQAMDPAKVDGLVELLAELARTRQVIVFSHDDRLPAALRRGAHDATILEVIRGPNSAVSTVVSQDPTTRYLLDAHGLIKEFEKGNLVEDDLRRTLPGLYRFAIESAAKDRYFADQLAKDSSIHDVESAWGRAQSTKQRVNLAVFGDPQPAEHLRAQWTAPEHRKKGLGIAGTAFHAGMAAWTDPETAHHHVKRLVDDISRGAK